MSDDKNKQEQIKRMLDAIKSAQFDELELPEINEKNRSAVESKKLTKRNENNNQTT